MDELVAMLLIRIRIRGMRYFCVRAETRTIGCGEKPGQCMREGDARQEMILAAEDSRHAAY